MRDVMFTFRPSPYSTRLFSILTVLAFTALVLFVPVADSHAAILYTAGPNAGSVPQQYYHQDPNFPHFGKELFAEADATRLSAMAAVNADAIDNFYAAFTVDDLIFSHADPSVTSTSVTIQMRFSGSASGAGNWSPNANIRLSSSVGTVTDAASLLAPDTAIDELLTITLFDVPLDEPVTFSALMEMRVAAGPNQFTRIDFRNSLDFIDLSNVFILDSGVTANSASWGLIDNSLSAVPLPASAWLFGSGLIGLVGVARKRGRESRKRM